MDTIVDAKVCVMNCPSVLHTGFLVVRLVNATLWYYGLYDSMDRAAKAAVELGNAFVMGICKKEDAE